jgi:hypothetical protein
MRASAFLFEPVDRAFVEAVVRLAVANPFGRARVLAERDALGADYVDAGPEWTPPVKGAAPRENARRLRARLTPLIGRLRERLLAGVAAVGADLVLYKEVCLFFLYDRFAERLRGCIAKNPARVEFYGDFVEEHAWLGKVPGVALPAAAHLFGCFIPHPPSAPLHRVDVARPVSAGGAPPRPGVGVHPDP